MKKLSLSSLFCRHDWELSQKATMDTALKVLPNLTSIKGKHTNIFFDQLILVHKCTKCNQLRFWKS